MVRKNYFVLDLILTSHGRRTSFFCINWCHCYCCVLIKVYLIIVSPLQKEEAEKKAKEDAERKEREMQERLKREEEERNERRKVTYILLYWQSKHLALSFCVKVP